MEIPITHAKLQGQRIALRTAGFFRGPQILLNGTPIKRKRWKYLIRNSQGQEVTVQIKSNHIDPIPKLVIDGEKVQLARDLTWYEYLWMGVPIVLVVSGGALGAMIGIGATYSSSRIFRSERGVLSKYLLSGLVSIGAIMGFIVLAVVIQILVHGVPQR